jgi:proline dehydrogenase
MDEGRAPLRFHSRIPTEPPRDSRPCDGYGPCRVQEIGEVRWGQLVNRIVSKAVWYGWGTLAKVAGRSYIAGPDLDDGLRACRRLSRLGYSSSLCFWNSIGDTPDAVATTCRSALMALAKEQLDCYISIKLPALNFDLVLLQTIIEQARQGNTLVHFDSLEPEGADQTFGMIAQAARSYPNLGCTLPGRWRRSQNDALLAADMGLHVRVVKGQWADPENPKIDLREGYLKVLEQLAGRARSVAVATHDPELATRALELLRAAGTPCSLELLYGLPVKPVLEIARRLNVRVRVYVPYGYGWLPYSLSQALRNPRIVWWLLRDCMTSGSPFGVGSPADESTEGQP